MNPNRRFAPRVIRTLAPLLLVVWVSAANASSQTILTPPLRGVTAAHTTVYIADPIRIDAPDAIPLFDRDTQRREKFEAKVAAELDSFLRARGIRPDEESLYGVGINFSGGHSPTRDARGVYVFMAVGGTSGPHVSSGEPVETFTRYWLGTANDAELEEVLLRVVAAFLEEIRVLSGDYRHTKRRR